MNNIKINQNTKWYNQKKNRNKAPNQKIARQLRQSLTKYVNFCEDIFSDAISRRNLVQTSGDDYVHHITACPPGFENLNYGFFKKLCTSFGMNL